MNLKVFNFPCKFHNAIVNISKNILHFDEPVSQNPVEKRRLQSEREHKKSWKAAGELFKPAEGEQGIAGFKHAGRNLVSVLCLSAIVWDFGGI